MPKSWTDGTALFYTLSTIAQTLAGAFGILAAFMVLRVQSATDQIHMHSAMIAKRMTATEHDDHLKRFREGKGLEQFMKWFDACMANKPENRTQDKWNRDMGWLKLAGKKMNHFGGVRVELMSRLRKALILTGVTVLFCFVLLPWVPWIVKYGYVSIAVAALAVILGIVTVCSYMIMIWTAVKPDPSHGEQRVPVDRAEG